jgi:septal ring factor EnvC (AmiA/AmiB activator)
MKGFAALLVIGPLGIGLLGMATVRPSAAEHEDTPVPATAGPFGGLGEKAGREMELRGIEDTLKKSDEQRRQIEAQVEAQRADRARLNDALIKTTTRVRNAETRINESEQRISVLAGSEDAIRRSLAGRRAVITEVLAALQRMGRKSPPAVLVEPEDILRAIRTSMMLGAVLPELRAETEALGSDLAELIQLRQTIAEERDALARDLASLNDERLRLAALVEVRQSSLAQAEEALGAERERADALSRDATNLKDLITGMEKEIAASARAAAAARAAEEAHRRAEMEGQKAKLATAPFNDPARLAPAIPFAEAKGLLPMPAAGTPVKAFGDSDGLGGTEKGISIATRAGAPVASPVDGWVAFSGPYRTYGQLLIINAGAGYYIVLAGMDRISIDVGQFVLAGEPVAVMGDGSARAAAAIAIGDARPILYVEFRKDGVAIDPGPWWAKPELQKVRG